MPWTDSEQNSGFWDIRAVGPVAQTIPTLETNPGTIAASGTWDSGVVLSDGFRVIGVGVTSSQAGNLSVQRYLDPAGTVAQGAGESAALSAGAPAVVNVTDGKPFAAFRITVSNSAASAADITGFAVLMCAA